MNAPLYEALCALAEKNDLRMHMPGHKGKSASPFFSVSAIDYTEIPTTGNLYTGEGPIGQAEELAAKAWGAAHAYFLTGGSTQGIMTGLSLCAAPGSKILLDRNTHKSFFNGCALLDLRPVYLREPTAEGVEKRLTAQKDIKAVCITSPTYYGVILDVAGIGAVCRRCGVKLLVDEAHGAHFPFVGRGPCAAGRGADISVSSAHKTLPALGSSALLFTRDGFSPAAVREKMAMFGTSSPSYPILASIDWARACLEGEGGAEYRRAAEHTARLRKEINGRGVFHALWEKDGQALDPTRLTVCTSVGGLLGTKAAEILQETYGIWPEMDNRDCVVCIITGNDSEEDLERLGRAFYALEALADVENRQSVCPPPPQPEICMSIREAVFSQRETVTLRTACGKVSAVSIAPYPPGVPVVAPGERIREEILTYFAQIGYDLDEQISVAAEGV